MALNVCPRRLQLLPVSSEKTLAGNLRKSLPSLTPSQNLAGRRTPQLQSFGNGGRASIVRAVKEEQTKIDGSVEIDALEIDRPSSKLVLVVGGTGGVGQLIVASLLRRNIKSHLLLRDPAKAKSLFGDLDENISKIWKGDTRYPHDLDPAIFEGVTHAICCTGTTAFPSRRWDGENTPEKVDWEGVRNLVSALPKTLKRFVLVSSVGVTKCDELPWRPGRLTDGPYTSYDLNTLLQATAEKRRAVVIGQGDKLIGEVSRLVVAEACIQALDIEFTRGKIYEINSVEGEGPGNDPEKWKELFKAAES